MRFQLKSFCIPCILFLLVACQQNPGEEETTSSTVLTTEMLESERDQVKTAPVAIFDEPIGDGLNDWHFTAKLFETKKRFRYLLDMRYQEITASDTIRFPNFGMEPQPKIQKGENKLECILGFLDKEGKFREYVKVFVEDGELRLKTLKHYAVVPNE